MGCALDVQRRASLVSTGGFSISAANAHLHSPSMRAQVNGSTIVLDNSLSSRREQEAKVNQLPASFDLDIASYRFPLSTSSPLCATDACALGVSRVTHQSLLALCLRCLRPRFFSNHRLCAPSSPHPPRPPKHTRRVLRAASTS